LSPFAHLAHRFCQTHDRAHLLLFLRYLTKYIGFTLHGNRYSLTKQTVFQGNNLPTPGTYCTVMIAKATAASSEKNLCVPASPASYSHVGSLISDFTRINLTKKYVQIDK